MAKFKAVTNLNTTKHNTLSVLNKTKKESSTTCVIMSTTLFCFKTVNTYNYSKKYMIVL